MTVAEIIRKAGFFFFLHKKQISAISNKLRMGKLFAKKI